MYQAYKDAKELDNIGVRDTVQASKERVEDGNTRG